MTHLATAPAPVPTDTAVPQDTILGSTPAVPVPTADAARTATRVRLRRPFGARGAVGAVLVLAVVAAGLLAPVLAPYDPLVQLPRANLLGPSAEHLLGTDQVNRDVWSRLLHGIRTDLLILALGVPIGAAVGTAAALAGTIHPAVDLVLQRVFDVVLAFPTLILAIGLVAVLSSGIPAVVAVIAIVEAPVFARMVRARILTVSAQPYVDAAASMGASRWWLLTRHVMPNSTAPLGVQFALSLSTAVFIEGAMSFLGIGVRPPQPSLGNLISDGIRFADSNVGYVVGPLLVVVALALGLQLITQDLVRGREVAR